MSKMNFKKNNDVQETKIEKKLKIRVVPKELKGYTNEILTGKNTFKGTDLSIGIVLNTSATRKHNGSTIVYGDSQPVLNLYQ